MTISPFCCCRAAKYIHCSGLFSFYFYLVLWKDDCQWTHGSLGKDSKSFKGSREVHDSVQHALFHEPFLLNRGPPPPQYKKQTNDSPTPLLLRGCSYLVHSSKHSLSTFCLTNVKNCGRQRSKKVSGTRACFSSKVMFVIDIGLVKIIFFSCTTTKTTFQWMSPLLSFMRTS